MTKIREVTEVERKEINRLANSYKEKAITSYRGFMLYWTK